MKKTYSSPQAVVYNTLMDVYCADQTISSAPIVVGEVGIGYGDTYATADGLGLLDE